MYSIPLLAILAIPFLQDYRLRDQLERLRQNGIIEDYSLGEIKYWQDLSLDPYLYDFKRRCWSFNWFDLEVKRNAPITSLSTDGAVPIDYTDVLILSPLAKKVPTRNSCALVEN